MLARLFAVASLEVVAQDPFNMTSSQILGGDAWASELLGAQYGDTLSTGRVLSFGSPRDRLAAVQEWGQAPLPVLTKHYHSHHLNSDGWDAVKYREGDIVIGTCIKAGTTWTQTIVANLLTGGDLEKLGVNESNGVGILDSSPWIDNRILALPVRDAGLAESLPSRRTLKTHLPLDGIPYSPDVKYIYVARDMRDVAWSCWNHWNAYTDLMRHLLNDMPGRVGPEIPHPGNWTVKEFFDLMIDDEADWYPVYWSCYHNLATWWQYKHLPNVLLVHYEEMKQNKEQTLRKFADFLEIELAEENLPRMLSQIDFKWMKDHEVQVLGGAAGLFEKSRFINKGQKDYWKDELSAREVELYEEYSVKRLGREAAEWMMTGPQAPTCTKWSSFEA